MIVSVGVDLIAIERVGRSVDTHGDRFLRRVFSPEEIALAAGRRERLAGRFAAKEAVLKVLRTGLAEGISWQDVRILAGERGEPVVDLSGQAAVCARARGIRTVHVSISHDREHAVAFAVGESGR